MTLVPFSGNLEFGMIADIIRNNQSVLSAHMQLIEDTNSWWISSGQNFVTRLTDHDAKRYSTLDQMKLSFVEQLSSNLILDGFSLRGAFAEWSNDNESTFRTIVETGFPAALIADDDVLKIEHGSLIDKRNELKLRVEEINSQYEILRRINRSGTSEDEEEELSNSDTDSITEEVGDFLPKMILDPLEAEQKEINKRVRELLSKCNDIHSQVYDNVVFSNLPKGEKPTKASTKPVTNDFRKLDILIEKIKGINSLDRHRSSLIQSVSEWETLIARKKEIVDLIKPHEDYKELRKNLNQSLIELKEHLFKLAGLARKSLPESFVTNAVIEHLRVSLTKQIQKRLDEHINALISIVNSMHKRYSITLSETRHSRALQSERVDAILTQFMHGDY